MTIRAIPSGGRFVPRGELVVRVGEVDFQAAQFVVMGEHVTESALCCVELLLKVLGVRGCVRQFVGYADRKSFQSLCDSHSSSSVSSSWVSCSGRPRITGLVPEG